MKSFAPAEILRLSGISKPRGAPVPAERRREHAVGGRFTCAAAGRACGDADDDVDAIDPFANDLATSFHQLLFDPKAVLEAMRPAGAPPKAGDGLIALQTLVHRGPGNNNCPFERKVLFFSLRPVFSDARDAVKDIGTYDPASRLLRYTPGSDFKLNTEFTGSRSVHV